MKNKKFEVKIYYSSFCTYTIEAKDEEDAILKARNMPVKNNEILCNLENWKEADTVQNEKN